MPADRTVALFDPMHRASIRGAEKAGFQERFRTIYVGQPALILERLKTPL